MTAKATMGFPKPEAREKVKARRDRLEAKVKRAVRLIVAQRDGYCRLAGVRGMGPCRGASQWAHLEARWKTRGKAPELRHRAETSVMLCDGHHDRLDGQAMPRIRVEPLTGQGAVGSLRWITTGGVYVDGVVMLERLSC